MAERTVSELLHAMRRTAHNIASTADTKHRDPGDADVLAAQVNELLAAMPAAVDEVILAARAYAKTCSAAVELGRVGSARGKELAAADAERARAQLETAVAALRLTPERSDG